MADLIVILFALWLVLWFYIFLPAKMASNRGRSALIWVLVSLVFSPLLAIFLLLVLGRAASVWKSQANA